MFTKWRDILGWLGSLQHVSTFLLLIYYSKISCQLTSQMDDLSECQLLSHPSVISNRELSQIPSAVTSESLKPSATNKWKTLWGITWLEVEARVPNLCNQVMFAELQRQLVISSSVCHTWQYNHNEMLRTYHGAQKQLFLTTSKVEERNTMMPIGLCGQCRPCRWLLQANTNFAWIMFTKWYSLIERPSLPLSTIRRGRVIHSSMTNESWISSVAISLLTLIPNAPQTVSSCRHSVWGHDHQLPLLADTFGPLPHLHFQETACSAMSIGYCQLLLTRWQRQKECIRGLTISIISFFEAW